jgi:UDP-N-acetylglucosamine acyltransferase
MMAITGSRHRCSPLHKIDYGMIHPTAIIHPKARVDSNVQVGPYAVIDEAVEIGARCVIGPHVYITGVTSIGSDNKFFAGCVIGEAPQDLKYAGAPTGVRIGNNNVIREHVTVHRSNKVDEQTVIGSHNFLMEHCHVAHNCHIKDYVIIANGALLGGHVTVDDRAFLSGNCLVHQFVRVGTLALMQGGAAISKDLAPYTIASRTNNICGLNMVGLRRAGINSQERLELKKLYHTLFRDSTSPREAAATAREKFTSQPSKTMLDFIAQSKRGVCAEKSELSTDDDTGD